MALNPQLCPDGMPVPFVDEKFFLKRGGLEFEVDKIPESEDGQVKVKGTIYVSQIRMVFVASRLVGNFVAFDMPLLYVHGEKFNQTIFYCDSISGFVEPVVPDDQHRALYSTHSFKILFKAGGCGLFVSLFFDLISSVRQYIQHLNPAAQPPVDPLQAAQIPVDEILRRAPALALASNHAAYDLSKYIWSEPTLESQPRRRNYHSDPAKDVI